MNQGECKRLEYKSCMILGKFQRGAGSNLHMQIPYSYIVVAIRYVFFFQNRKKLRDPF